MFENVHLKMLFPFVFIIICLIITIIVFLHCPAFFDALCRSAKVQPKWSLASLLFVTSWSLHLYYQADACPIVHVTEKHYHVRNGARLTSINAVSHYPSRIETSLLIYSEPSVHCVSVTSVMMLHHVSICQFIKCVCIRLTLRSETR